MTSSPQPATYVIALGSNRRGRHGAPADEIRAALDAIDGVVAVAPIVWTPPMGAARRRFANTVALIASDEMPDALLARLKAIEAWFGRRRGRRWADRVIDLDIILWSGGVWAGAGLVVPHAGFRSRRFVLDPLVRLVPAWRDPLTGLTVRHLAARLRQKSLTSLKA